MKPDYLTKIRAEYDPEGKAVEMPALEGAVTHEARPYGEWCRKPEACAGKGYCPLDPTCGD